MDLKKPTVGRSLILSDLLRDISLANGSGPSKRVVLVIDQAEYGGLRVRDLKTLRGVDLLRVRQDLGRVSQVEMRELGLLVPAGKGSGRRGLVRASSLVKVVSG